MAGPLDEANALISSPIAAASQGLPRRHTGQVVTRENTAGENALAEAEAAGTRSLGYAPAVLGLARQVTGDQAGAQDAYRTSQSYDTEADRIGSQSSAPTDYRDVDGIASGLAYARRLAIGSAPDMAASIGLGGLGRGLARRTAMNVEREAVATRVTQNIANGIETPLTRQVAARQAAEVTIPATQAVADAQAREAVQNVAEGAVLRGAGAGRVDAAGRAGALAGAAAGQFPGLVSESREELQKTDQEGALKVGAADALAAAVGALPAERLLGRIAANPAAREAIDQSALSLGRQLAGRAGKAAKGTLVQAGLEGTTEVAQAAIQRAGHSFVNSNIRLLSPDAIDDYVANFIGGAVLGGISGGAVETGNAAVGGIRDTAAWVRDRGGPMRETIRARLADQAEKMNARFQREAGPVGPQAGESMGTTDAPDVRSAAERFQSVIDGGVDLARRAGEAATDAAGRFETALRGIVNRDDVELRADQVLDDLQASMDNPRAANDAPVLDKAPTFTQKWMLSKVNPMFLATANESDALRLGRIMEKYATGQELTRREATTLSRVVENPNSGIDQRTLDVFTGIGPSVAELSSRMSESAGAEAATPQLKAQTQRTEDVDATEAADAVQESELGQSAAPRGPLRQTAGEVQEQRLSRLAELNAVVQRGIQRPEQMPANTADKRAAYRQSRTEVAAARKERDELQEQVISSVLGNKSPTQKRANGEPVRANVFDENRSAAGQKRWAEAEASPNYVRLADTWSLDGSDRPAAQRRTMLNIPFAVEAQLARHGADFQGTQQERGEAAFMAVLAEAQAGGIPIDTSSLTPGDVTLQKRGRPKATRLFTLTPDVIRRLTVDTNTPAQAAARRQTLTLKMADRPGADQGALPAANGRRLTAAAGRRVVAAERRAMVEGMEESQAKLANNIFSRKLQAIRAEDSGAARDPDALARIRRESIAELAQRRRVVGRGVDEGAPAREAGGNELEQADTRTRVPREQPQGAESRGLRDSDMDNFVSENVPLVTGAKSVNPALDKIVSSMQRNFAGTVTLEQQQEAANRRYRRSPEGKAMLAAMDENTASFAALSNAEANLAKEMVTAGQLPKKAAAEVVAGAAARNAYAETFARVSQSAKGGTPAVHALDRLLAKPEGLAAANKVDAIVRDKAAGVDGAAQQLTDLTSVDPDAKQYVQLQRTLATEHRIVMEAAREAAAAASDKAHAQVMASALDRATNSEAALAAAKQAVAAARAEHGPRAEAYEKAKAAYEAGGKGSVPVYSWGDVAKAVARVNLRDQLDAGLINQETATAELARIKEMPDAEAYGYVELATSGGSVTHAKAASDAQTSNDTSVDPASRALWKSVSSDAAVVAPGESTANALADAFGITFNGAGNASPEIRAAAMRLINSVSALADGARTDADGNYTNRLFDFYDMLSSMRMRGNEVSAHEVRTNTGTANFDADGVESDANAPVPKTQLAAEAAWANRVLAMAGAKSNVRLGNYSKSPMSGLHVSRGNDGQIYLGTGLRGGERYEVLAHELGHHLMFDHIRQMAEGRNFDKVTNEDVAKRGKAGGGTLNMIEALDPELGAALRKDYEKWFRSLNGKTTVGQLRQSRSPILRAQNIIARGNGDMTLSQLDRNTLRYQTSFDEWAADNIARALLHRREVTDSMSAVSKFFTEIANKLRALYDSLVGNGYRPAESVEAWVAQMFDSVPAAVQTLTGSPTRPSAQQTQAVVEAAVVASHAPAVTEGPGPINQGGGTPPPAAPANPTSSAPPPKDFAGMMRYVRDFLPPAERQVLEQAFSRDLAHQRLRKIYAERPDVQRAMTDAATGMEARIAAGYLAWQAGEMTAGPKSQSVLIGVGDIFRELLGVASNATYAHRIMNDIQSGKVQRFKETGRVYDSAAAERRARGIRQQVVDQATNVAQTVWRPFERLLDSNLARMNSSGIPAYRAIGAALYKPTGASGGDVGYVRAVAHTSAKFSAQAARAMEGLSDGQQRRVLRLLQEQATPERLNSTVSDPKHFNYGKNVYSPQVRRAFNEVRTLMNDAFQYLDKAGVQVGYRKNFFPLMLDLHNDRAAAKLTELLSKPEYEQAIRDIYKDRPRTAPTPKRARKTNAPPIDPAAEKYFSDLREKLADRLEQAGGEDTRLQRMIEVNQSIVEAMRTGNIATIEKHIAAAEKRRSRYEDGSDAAKVIDIENRFARSRIEQLKAAPAQAEAAAPAGPGSNSPVAELVADLVNGARRENVPFGNVDLSEGAPNFRAANFRLMEFVYRLRDEAAAAGDTAATAMHNENIRQFAALQVKDPQEAFSRYLEPAVRRAEYARRFGDDGAKLNDMLEQMKDQGADAGQIKHARAAVEAAVGAYGRDLSPTLAAVSPELAKRVSGERTRAILAGVQTYQNSRSLPLALLSSLVDPMGIAVRSGGDFATAWKGFKTGIKSLGNKATREEIHQMLQMLGSTSDMGSAEVLTHAFGGAGSPTTAKVNDFIFKLNGMAAWTRATRYMALVSAHEFALKHATSNDDTSARYRDELGLQKGDVSAVNVTAADGSTRRQVKLLSPEELAKATPEQAAADARVKQALMQFVDEAILRPNSQQTPLWHSDPYMSLLSQYKAFSYAIYEQILGRVNLELQNGNSKVALAAMAYLPIVIAAELLRNIFQGDEEDTDDWGPAEYLAMGVERSGLYSPTVGTVHDVVEDVRANRTPGSSLTGPTLGQARNIGQALEGRRDLGKEFEAALPGSALYKKWNDSSRNTENPETAS